MRRVPAGRASPHSEAGALAAARDRSGSCPRAWLIRALDSAEPLVELRRTWVRSDGPLELHRGASALVDPGNLPVRTRSIGAVALDMCLPSLPDLDPLLSELRRVLRPTGTFAALVPAIPTWSPAELRAWWPLHRALGGRPRFRHESVRDHLHWLVAAADFAVLSDDRRMFRLPVPDPASASSARRVVDGLVLDGVWPTDIGTDRLELARDTLARYAVPGRTLPIPLRLLVARR